MFGMVLYRLITICNQIVTAAVSSSFLLASISVSGACESWTCASLFCLYTTGEETFAIYIIFFFKKKKKILHCTVSINTDFQNTLKGFWASVREWRYNTKLGPSLSS